MPPWSAIALCSSALFLAACGPERRYHLEAMPIPDGAERRITGILKVDGKDEAVDAAMPWVWDREADSLTGTLTSRGAGGMRLRLAVTPKGSVIREIEDKASGDHGVRGTIGENLGGDAWGVWVKVVPLEPPAAPAAQ